MQTITLAQRLEEDMNSLVSHSAKLEMNNTQLKQAIRILAKKISGEEMTQRDAEFVKHIVDDNNVFLTATGQVYENE